MNGVRTDSALLTALRKKPYRPLPASEPIGWTAFPSLRVLGFHSDCVPPRILTPHIQQHRAKSSELAPASKTGDSRFES